MSTYTQYAANAGQTVFGCHGSRRKTVYVNGVLTVPASTTFSSITLASGVPFLTPVQVDGDDTDYGDITGSSYTLSAFDNGVTRCTTAATAVTVTIAPGLPFKFSTTIVQRGAGQILLAPLTGVTLVNVNSQTKSSGINAAISLVQVSTETYELTGSTGA